MKIKNIDLGIMSIISGRLKLSPITVRATASVVIAVLTGINAHAQNLVKNGDFKLTTNGNGHLGYNTNLTDWTVANNSYNFLYTPETIDKTGTTGDLGTVYMWGPNSGSNNGLTGIAPTGGNIVAADGAFRVGAISQTITGLIVNQTYNVSFYWAGAQQYNFSGATTEQWQVTFGNERKDTVVLQNDNHGFTGWRQESFDFVATSSSQALSFLAAGTPSGEPPFSLLSGVSVTAAIPESGAMGLMLSGVVTGVLLLRKRKRTLVK